MGIFLCLRGKHNPNCGKKKKEERFILIQNLLSVELAQLMLAVMLPVTAMAEENYVMISGITGVENEKYDSFKAAYNAIKPKLEALCKSDALGQGGTTAEEFDALFFNRDENGNATLTYTICGNIIYDESNLANLLTFGRRASHYGNDRHLINFKFVGATGRDSDTLTVNSNITLPYEWWGEKTTTSISFENLTITGTARSGLYPTQDYFEGINFKVDNCKLEGIKIYHYNNVKGNITFTNNIFDGTGTADAYAVHLQGSATEPLTINISNNIISNYARGINIDQKTAEATIKDNTIKDLCGITKEGNTYGSAIQLTQGTSITVTDNTISTENVNALHFYKGLEADVTISNNNIKAPYLLWNEANLDQSKITSSGNTLDIANPGKAMTKETGVIDSTTTINGTMVEHPIVIITPTEETKPAEDQKNPATGANDVVAAAVALMAVSALGMAALTRKK